MSSCSRANKFSVGPKRVFPENLESRAATELYPLLQNDGHLSKEPATSGAVAALRARDLRTDCHGLKVLTVR